MRRGLVFAALTAPVLVGASVAFWAQWKIIGWTPGRGELSLPIRVGLALNNWTIRCLPFAVIALVLTWPLIVLGVAALTGAFSSRNTATRRDVVLWWCVSAIAFAAMFLTVGVSYLLRPDAEPPAAILVALAWMAIVAFWVSLAAAYAVQQKRYLGHESAWHPKWLLAAVMALNCLGLYALPLLAAIAFRRGESRLDATDR
jgi:hypothetical protein